MAFVQSCRKILRDTPVKTASFLEGCLSTGLRDSCLGRSGAWAEGEPTIRSEVSVGVKGRSGLLTGLGVGRGEGGEDKMADTAPDGGVVGRDSPLIEYLLCARHRAWCFTLRFKDGSNTSGDMPPLGCQVVVLECKPMVSSILPR